MSIASEIERLINAKVDIKLSIENKGVDVDDNATLDDYSDYIDDIQTGTTPTGTTSITTNGTHDVTNYASANVNVQPNLQSKSETITTNTTTTISPDNGYDGLSSVSITTNVSGGTTPTKGTVINSWDSDGYATEVTTYGFTKIPNYYFYNNSSNGYFVKKINKINFNNGITELGNYSFYYLTALANQTTLPDTITTISEYCFTGCSNMPLIKLPDNLTTLQTSCFYKCSKITITNIPNGVTVLPGNCFGNCTSIKKISMSNVTTMAESFGSSAFSNCVSLKQAWIGSSITSSGFSRFSFSGCTNLEKMYIDLPRATVEAFTNYQYAFMNNTSKTGIIICNDDNDFITKAQFDAIDVNTL